MPRRTLELTMWLYKFTYRSLTFYALLSQVILLSYNSTISWSEPLYKYKFGLFRFRSPLLTESINLSFPLGTKMFQSPRYVFKRTQGPLMMQVSAPGSPIRKSSGQSLHQLANAYRR